MRGQLGSNQALDKSGSEMKTDAYTGAEASVVLE